MLYGPALFVVTVVSTPVSVFRTTMVALGRTPPLLSTTVPFTEPVMVWA
jgi:hypothetical protein